MIIKKLRQSGNSKALVIDKSLLQAAGLDEDALFNITVNPNGGLLIQSLSTTNEALFDIALSIVMKKNKNIIKKLADK